MKETSRSSSTLSLYKTQDGYPIERKVINPSGRLGSLYDASTDNLIDQHAADVFESKTPHTRSICRLFSGDSSKGITTYLKDIDYDDALRQSLCLRMVTLQGISRLMEYNQPIDENTRFLYYCYRARKEWLEVTAHKTDQIVAPPSSSTAATHMITKIVWGFEILSVIQIPSNQPVEPIDQLLHSIYDQLKNNRIPITIKGNNQYLLTQLKNMTIFGSERCIDQSNVSLLTVLSRIKNWQKDSSIYQPLVYTMQPLRWLYNGSEFLLPCSFPKPDNPHVVRIETLMNRFDRQIKDLQEMFENLPTMFSSTKLDERLKAVQQKYRFLMGLRDNLQERLRVALADLRCHRFEPSALDDIIGDQQYQYLRNVEMEKFLSQVQQLLNKSQLIERLKNDQIEYINAFDICPNHEAPSTINEIDTILKDIYSHENNSVILWYSSDRLKREEENRYQQIYQELAWKQQTQIVYLDFTYIIEKLEDFIIVRLPSCEKDTSRHPSPIDLNVLLIGETGIGKSTFINAFANYLKFESLQEAEQGKPIILRPVSFSITVADQIDEFAVKLDNVDLNENLDHVGQSVTQQCKSYVFELNSELRLRFIDTPGISDIRSREQNVKVIDQTLSYINGLSHLNAICLFVKPDVVELHDAFNSYVKPLLTYLTPSNFHNILFCFTHSKLSTSELANDADLLIQKMLEDQRLNDISLRKENTFCFSNESFRYLTARKCGINLEKYQKQECIQSWNTSATESVRLLNFIHQCRPCSLEKCLSLGKFILDISILARPLMETLRLIIYNWKLNEAKLIINHMELESNPISVESCTNCAQINIVELGPFRVTQYQPNDSDSNSNKSLHHRCPVDKKHFLIESNIKYEFVLLPAGLKNERWQSSFNNFLFKCDQLLHFLRQQELVDKDDPFQPILDRYIEEEKQISQMFKLDSNMNRQVREVLESVKQIREINSQQLFESNEQLSLHQVYQIMHGVLAMSTVRRQIDSIKTSRRLKMAKHERLISKDLIRNTIFASFTHSHR